MNTPPPFRVAIYTQKSTDENLDQDFNSLDAQWEAALTYIDQRRHLGWIEIPKSYEDGGYSGGNMDRPALQQLLCDVEAGVIDCVIVYKLDRISRSLLDFAKLLEYFERHKVAFVSVTQEFDSSTPVGRLTLNILSSFSQFEREIISERIRDKIAASRRKGIYTGGIPPFGYTNDPAARRLVINPVEAAIVRRIFTDYLASYSVTTVTRQLNDDHIPTKCHTTVKGREYRGTDWSTTQVWKVLQNPLYQGKVRYQGILYQGQHEPILDSTTWEQVQAIIGRQARKVRVPRQSAFLKGLLRCGHCGCAMSPSSSRKGAKTYRYYLCSTSHRRVTRECPTCAIPAGTVETAVTEFVARLQRYPAPLVAQLAGEDITPARQQAGYVLCAKLHQLQQTWGNLEPTSRQTAIRDLLQRVTVYPDRLEVAFIGGIPADRPQVEIFTLTLPLEVKSSLQHATTPTAPTPFQTMTARAYMWRRMLDDSQYADIRELAAAVKFDPSYVARTLNLTLLSPGLLAEIMQGSPIASLPTSHLPKTWPMSWTEQREVFSSLYKRYGDNQ